MSDGTGAGVEPIVGIRGDWVALGPLLRDLLALYQRWANDFAVLRTFDVPVPRTLEGAERWHERTVACADGVRFLICEAATGRPIGHTGLFDIDGRNRTAAFGPMIGEAGCRGRGYGTETARLMLDYAFTALGLRSVLLETDGYNLAGQRAYAKAGFREFGRRRQCQLLAGELWDVVYMECLATEFDSPAPGTIFAPGAPRS